MSTKKDNVFSIEGRVWLYSGETASWHFVSLSKECSRVIRERFGSLSKGWGSLPVSVSLGETLWKTSMFPDRKAGVYMIPLKALVRSREGVAEGDTVTLTIQVLV
jgi:hypothetical protein